MKVLLALCAVGASVALNTPNQYFSKGDAPKCQMLNGHTLVQFDTELHPSFHCSHNAAQTNPEMAEMRHHGMDCITGKIQNNLEAGILEPALSKVKMIQFATEAAITVLRIDDMIKLAPEEQGQ